MNLCLLLPEHFVEYKICRNIVNVITLGKCFKNHVISNEQYWSASSTNEPSTTDSWSGSDSICPLGPFQLWFTSFEPCQLIISVCSSLGNRHIFGPAKKTARYQAPKLVNIKIALKQTKNPNFHLYHRLYSFVEAFKTNHLQTKVSRKKKHWKQLFVLSYTLAEKNVLTSKYYKWKPQTIRSHPTTKPWLFC